MSRNTVPRKRAGLEPKEIYHGEVTWTRKFKFQPGKDGNGFGVSGSIHYGVCNQATCLPPQTVNFQLGDLKGAGKPPAPLADDSEPMANNSYVAESGSLGFLSVRGVLWRNAAECDALRAARVGDQSPELRAAGGREPLADLPVERGLFGRRAGGVSRRWRRWPSAPGWDCRRPISRGADSFADTRFNLVMACLVFAMGLSLLGVFEIPVPGMVGSAAGGNRQEGLLGALLTGIFATLLATPCTGPIMAAAVGWSVRQPTFIVYLVWGVMGLGMASPYLVLGLFPQLVRWLPKPGTWMIRLKEFAGFVLLASVIFIIYYTDKRFTIPVLVMLLGVALGLWMIGNLYDINSHIRHKTTVRAMALFLTALICWIGFSLSVESKYKLHWEPFSESRLTALFKEKKTVLIDFTAEWCINCHVNERVALNTAGDAVVCRAA